MNLPAVRRATCTEMKVFFSSCFPPTPPHLHRLPHLTTASLAFHELPPPASSFPSLHPHSALPSLNPPFSRTSVSNRLGGGGSSSQPAVGVWPASQAGCEGVAWREGWSPGGKSLEHRSTFPSPSHLALHPNPKLFLLPVSIYHTFLLHL